MEECLPHPAHLVPTCLAFLKSEMSVDFHGTSNTSGHAQRQTVEDADHCTTVTCVHLQAHRGDIILNVESLTSPGSVSSLNAQYGVDGIHRVCKQINPNAKHKPTFPGVVTTSFR